MEYMKSLEADKKQLPTKRIEACYVVNPNQVTCRSDNDGKTTMFKERYVQRRFLKLSDQYSVIEEIHPELVDIGKPYTGPHRWSPDAMLKTNVIFDKSGSFGPMRFVELVVDTINENRLSIHIKKSFILNATKDGCIETLRYESEVEGLKFELFHPQCIDSAQLHSISTLLDNDNHWSEQPRLSLFSLVQYWVFHHHKVVDWLKEKEMHDA